MKATLALQARATGVFRYLYLNWLVDVLRFEWDEAKNNENRRKHGVTFEDASEVFRDPLQVTVLERVVGGEKRWQTFGLVGNSILLMVAHAIQEREENATWVDVIRIISARPATRNERRRHEEETG